MALSLSKILGSVAAAVLLAAAGAANAETYELVFTGSGISGDIFAVTSGTGSEQPVTSISGWLTDADAGAGTFDVTGLSQYAGATNLYYLDSPFVDYGGISFTTNTGGDFNLGLGGSDATGLVLHTSTVHPGGYAGVAGSDNVEMIAAVVPEPTTIAMMLAGVLGLAGVARRRTLR